MGTPEQPRDGDGKWAGGSSLAHVMDHGQLNIPLSKRGDIDAQLDKYKADKAKTERVEAKAATVQKKTDKAAAKELYAEHGAAMLDRYGPKFGRGALKSALDDMVKWEPNKFLRLHEKYSKENTQK